MNSRQSKESGGGWVIPLCQNNPGRNLIIPEQADEVIRPLNALGKMRVVYDTSVTEPDVLFSQGNVIIRIPKPTSSGSVTIEGLPWQISEVATNTIQVTAGRVFVSGLPGHDTVAVPKSVDSTNTETNITIPASSETPVWIKIYDTGGAVYAAEVNVGTPPAAWVEYPAPQFFDRDWYDEYDVAYVRIGVVDNSVSPTTITQELFDNPKILDFTSDRRLTAQAGVLDWDSGAAYRLGALCTWFGTLYSRNSRSYGDSGSEPGTGLNDWVAIA